MKTFSLFLVTGLIFLASCQKEISYNINTPPGTGGNTDSTDTTGNNKPGELLVKTVSVENGGTYTTLYAYDANKRIETITQTGVISGVNVGSYRKFYRDAAGRIIRIAAKLPPQGGIDVDTAFTYVYYPDATTFNFSYTVQHLSVGGFEVDDSTLYTFNSGNQVTKGYDYQTSPLLGPVQESESDFTFDAAGNNTSILQYSNLSGTVDLVQTIKMEYDNNINPFSYDKQTFLVSGGNPGASHNNLTVLTVIVVGQPGEQSNSFSYSYNSNGLPSVVTQKDLTNNSIITTTFYYQ